MMGENANLSGSLGEPNHHPSSPEAMVLWDSITALRHDPGLAKLWSSNEQSILEEELSKYAGDPVVVRYAKIAMLLPNKTIRDVALRCTWMVKQESNKKRKEELANKSNENKERVGDSSTKGPAPQPNNPSYSLPVLPIDDDEVPYKAIRGPTGELLEYNAHILNQIYMHISNMKVHENISLFSQARDNILAVLKEDNNAPPEIMSRMPSLHVKLNEDLANSILPRTLHPDA